MIIVDANIITYFFMGGEFQTDCRKVFKKDTQWCVPYLWQSEFRNVLMLYVKTKRCSTQTAKEVMKQALELFLENQIPVSSDKVLDLASSSQCSAYDCEYVALAEGLQIPLVTMDEKILRVFSKVATSPGKFLENK